MTFLLFLGEFVTKYEGTLVTEEYDVVIGETVVAHSSFQRIQTIPAGTNYWEAMTKNIRIVKPYSFTNLTIKNNKCYCYPYNYLLVTNNIGGINTYRYEDFPLGYCDFERQLALSIGVSGRVVPKNYKGVAENLDETVSLGKYPTCQWSSDSYTNWLTQNAVNIEKAEMNMDFTRVRAGTNLVKNAFNLQFGTAMTSMIESGMTLENQIADLQGEFYAGKLLPNKLGGTADGDVNFSSLDNGFKFIKMRAKNEYMLAIDNYFTRFGYKILRVKIPETNSRRYWNYLQIGTGESLGFGDIPQEALSGINQIAQKGTTIWHDHEIIGDYSLTNSIR